MIDVDFLYYTTGTEIFPWSISPACHIFSPLAQTKPNASKGGPFILWKTPSWAVRLSGRAGPPTIIGHGSAAGYKESQGPLGRHFDHTCKDDTFGEKSWEMAESQMQQLALDAALKRAGLHTPDLDLLLAGDLLNQCIGSSFAARQASVPYLGLYGACSTMGESLALAALLLAGGYGRYAAAVTSSHFCSAERQYRTPLEYGGQRAPTAQWTATAAGALVLAAEGKQAPPSPASPSARW